MCVNHPPLKEMDGRPFYQSCVYGVLIIVCSGNLFVETEAKITIK